MVLPHPRLCFCDAFTLPVNTTAFVAEVFAAPAGHVVAPCGAFYPEIAMRTLLIFLSFDELEEGLVTGAFIVGDLVFFARLANVVVDATVQAVSFLAGGAVELRCLLLLGVEDERELAVSRWTP